MENTVKKQSLIEVAYDRPVYVRNDSDYARAEKDPNSEGIVGFLKTKNGEMEATQQNVTFWDTMRFGEEITKEEYDQAEV